MLEAFTATGSNIRRLDGESTRPVTIIASVSGTTPLPLGEELLDGAVQRALAAGRTIAPIDLGSGTANYLGNPRVVPIPSRPPTSRTSRRSTPPAPPPRRARPSVR